jgi:hypothetical protein
MTPFDVLLLRCRKTGGRRPVWTRGVKLRGTSHAFRGDALPPADSVVKDLEATVVARQHVSSPKLLAERRLVTHDVIYCDQQLRKRGRSSRGRARRARSAGHGGEEQTA